MALEMDKIGELCRPARSWDIPVNRLASISYVAGHSRPQLKELVAQ